jgi:hypothetical protein
MGLRARDGLGVAAVLVFLVTAVRSIAKMGPVPDGTCGTSPSCPNRHQWVALQVLAALCVVLAVLTAFEVLRDRADRGRGMPSKWFAITLAVGLAIAVLVVDPADHLNSPDADWFGHSLSDGSLD